MYVSDFLFSFVHLDSNKGCCQSRYDFVQRQLKQQNNYVFSGSYENRCKLTEKEKMLLLIRNYDMVIRHIIS
ncbi:hypothetical protein GGE67_005982 [Rhizobium leucaenae]|uniref:Uncharacterized protein n=1 Tax=Rhizobium leucaenae TaxID=29450 RepID=A0A7W7A048_9HYPH|nr:hypothetical protein [Rhizobium leucaenae]MBB6305315.1 hypothetical protein [Rhizobium leucaenae]